VWFYDGVRDRFDQQPANAMPKLGTGVVGVFDRINNLLLLSPKELWAGGNVAAFDSAKNAWRDTGQPGRSDMYTFACYVDSLKGLMVIDRAKDQPSKTWLYDAAANAWRDLAPGGDALPDKGRPTLAYDPGNDVVLCIGLGTTLAYSVKDNRWTDLKQATKAAEGLVFDRRHKVFITASWGNEPEALRYKGNGE
jgi:hypothetical protein